MWCGSSVNYRDATSVNYRDATSVNYRDAMTYNYRDANSHVRNNVWCMYDRRQKTFLQQQATIATKSIICYKQPVLSRERVRIFRHNIDIGINHSLDSLYLLNFLIITRMLEFNDNSYRSSYSPFTGNVRVFVSS